MKKCLVGAIALLALTVQGLAESSDVGNWYVNPGAGVMIMNTRTKGDIPKRNPAYATLRLGYDFPDSPFSLEGGILFAPSIDTGRHSGLNQIGGVFIDGLYHFDRYARFDPYISLGLGGFQGFDHGKPFPSETRHVMTARAGLGAFYHMTDNWSLRANASFNLILGDPSESFETIDLGIVYRFNASKSAQRETFAANSAIEPGAKEYTETLNKKFDGAVIDTTPEDSLDTMKLELRINYDRDVSMIKPEYLPALDEIVRVIKKAMAQNPDVTVTVEGHADRTHGSNAKYNQELSETRANWVQDYLISNGVPAGKITAAGYGFDRPKIPHDMVNGTPENRRTEIFINGVGGAENRQKLRD